MASAPGAEPATAPPARIAPSATPAHGGTFGAHSATTSPGATPSAGEPGGDAVDARGELAEGDARPARGVDERAVRSGARRASGEHELGQRPEPPPAAADTDSSRRHLALLGFDT